MKTEEIKKGIAAYHLEQEMIVKAIRDNGGQIHQDEFDDAFGNPRRRLCTQAEFKKYGTKYISEYCEPHLWPLDRDAFILGDMNGGGEWSQWLELTQFMVAAGMLKQSGKKGNIRYALP